MAQKKKPSKNGDEIKSAVAKKAASSAKRSATKAVKKYTRSVGALIAPWVFIIFAVIMAVILILGVSGGGIGILGAGIVSFFGGFFGLAAYGLPLVLGYIGIRWCIFNIKWDISAKSASHSDHADYVKASRRLKLAVSMSCLLLLTISAFIGVLADQRDFAIGDLWNDGWNGEGGGVLGGALSCLFLVCFETVISIVLCCIFIVLFALLAVGVTPNLIIRKIREKHIENAERRAEDNEILAMQAEETEKKTSQKPSKAMAAAAAAQVVTESVKEKAAEEPQMTPPEKDTPEVTITPAPEMAKSTRKPTSQVAKESSIPLDFGGDSEFDTNEYNSLNDVMKDLGTPIAPTPPPSYKQEKPAAVAEDEPKLVPPIALTQMSSEELLSDMEAVVPDEQDGEETPVVITPYVFPSVELLNKNNDVDTEDHTEELQKRAQLLVDTLKSFRVGVQNVTYSRGPTITRYELKPEVGTRVRSIANLVDDIALNLATAGVRIEAPIPGKAAVGIEVPNETRATVYLRDLIDNPKFTDSKSKLTAALGMDVGGNPIYFDIGKMPHLLIAGTTGSGKSICINCIIMSILYKAKPDELKLILIDPKKVEFNMYKNIPHLYCPIVSEPKKAAGALASAVSEMERRFELIESAGVRDIASYNAIAENDPDFEYMPHMVIIIDELADLMMTARDEVETSICRLAQKARAAGIHVILGTQRPSVDVITGLIKANVPSRIACTVMSQVDSRTIIDVAGAESLIGRGDMLFAPVGASKPMRVQGAFVSDGEVEKIVTFIKENNGEANYNSDFISKIEEEAAKCGMGKKGASAVSASDMAGSDEGGDSKFQEAVKLVIEEGKASTSLMQRRLGVGYGRAAKMLDTMEQMGYIGPSDGNKPRRVLITMDEYLRLVVDGDLGDAE